MGKWDERKKLADYKEERGQRKGIHFDALLFFFFRLEQADQGAQVWVEQIFRIGASRRQQYSIVQ